MQELNNQSSNTAKRMGNDRDHSRLYSILGILMYVFYLLGHIPVSEFCYYLRDTYSFAVYQYYILLTGKMLLGLLIVGILWQLKTTQNRLLKIGLWLSFLLGVGYFYHDLIVFDIEYIHFIQYCVLTVVLFHAFKKRYWLALLLGFGLGVLDELYQAYHPPVPLNWRDVLLNILGAVAGGLVLLTVEKNKHSSQRPIV